MAYTHGVSFSEIPTGVQPPVQVDSALPVYVGTAPIHAAPLQTSPSCGEREVVVTGRPWICATVGFGYVPLRSPPAVPLGGSELRVAHAAVPPTTVRIWPVVPIPSSAPVPLPVPSRSWPLAVKIGSTSAAVRVVGTQAEPFQ